MQYYELKKFASRIIDRVLQEQNKIRKEELEFLIFRETGLGRRVVADYISLLVENKRATQEGDLICWKKP